jgi:PST family polysaccharide transporter
MISTPAKPPSHRAALGVLLLSGSNSFRLCVQFLLFPVLARLLSPTDYGLMALAMPVVMFALTIGEGGMGPALVRSADPDGSVEATMFWTALATGLGCAAILVLSAPLIAGALANTAVAPVLIWLAPIMVLSSVCSVPSARIQKRGATWIFALGDVASTVSGAALALYGALTGWQVWSLVAQQLAIWTVKLMVMLGLAGKRTRGKPGREAFRYLWLHGPPLVGANLLTLFSASIDTILIGRLIGVELLGFYSLAYQIVRIPESVLSGPIFISFLPAIARMEGDRRAAAGLFVSTLRMMLGVAAPMMIGLTLTADLAVALLLGPRWHGTASLIMVLAPSAIVQTLGFLSMALLIGRGRSGLQFRLALLNAALTLIGVLAGSFFGIFGVASGVALAVVIGSLVCLTAAMREVDVSPRTLAVAFSPVLAAVAIMICGTSGLRLLLPASLPVLPSLVLAAATGALLYGGAMRVLAPDMVTAALVPFRRSSRQ